MSKFISEKRPFEGQSDDGMDEKCAARSLYYRRRSVCGGKRRNEREQRRRYARVYKRRDTITDVSTVEVIPHGKTDPGAEGNRLQNSRLPGASSLDSASNSISAFIGSTVNRAAINFGLSTAVEGNPPPTAPQMTFGVPPTVAGNPPARTISEAVSNMTLQSSGPPVPMDISVTSSEQFADAAEDLSPVRDAPVREVKERKVPPNPAVSAIETAVPVVTASKRLKDVRNTCAHAVVDTQPVDAASRKEILEDSSVVSALSEMQKDAESVPEAQREQVDTWMGHAENLLIFAYQMYRASSITDAFAATVAYIKMYIKGKSIAMELLKLLNDVTTPSPKKEEEDDDSTIDSDDVDPHGVLDTIVNTWDLLKNHAIFSKISYLISAALSMTVSSIREIKWSPGGLKLIHIEALKEQLKAVDLIDAIVRTFAWMVETGYQCMKECSLAPLLYGNQRMREFYLLFDEVSAKANDALAGNCEDFGEFEKKVDAALDLVCSLKKVRPDGTTAGWLQARYEKLVEIKEKAIAKRKNTNMRFAPIGWSISGPTGVGKSTLSKLTMNTSLKAMKFQADPSRIITMDDADKYQSTYTSDIEGVYFDDFANMSPRFAAGNGDTPASKLIKFFNNMAAQAVKAELQEKGRVFIDFKCGVVTTNVKDLDARYYSNAPEAILRRFYHVSVEVQSKFQKVGSVSLNPAHPEILKDRSLLKDVWSITVERVIAFVGSEGRVHYDFEPMDIDTINGPIHTEEMTLSEYLQVVAALSREHKEVQDRVVSKANEFDTMEYCGECCLPKPMCICQNDECVPHAYEALTNILADTVRSTVYSYFDSWTSPLEWLNYAVGYSPIRRMITQKLAKEIFSDLDFYITPWFVAFIPQDVYSSTYFQYAVSWWQTAAALYDFRKHLKRFFYFTLFGLFLSWCNRSWVGVFWVCAINTFCTFYLWVGYLRRKYLMRRAYNERRDALPAYVKELRDSDIPTYALMTASLVIGVKLLHIWNNRRLQTQGLESPASIDQSLGWFDRWLGSVGFKYQSNPAVKNVSPDQVTETLPKNLWWATFERSNGTTTGCNIVSLQNGFILMPEHIFYPGGDMTKVPCPWVNVSVVKTAKGAGARFRFKAERSTYSYLFEELDMRMVYVPNLDNVKSAWRFLPVDQPTGSNVANFFLRESDGQLTVEVVNATMKRVAHKFRSMPGGDYTATSAKDGACMGLVTAKKNSPVILGFHIGGNGKGYGIMQTLTLPRYLEAISLLGKQDGVVVMAQSAELPKQQFGRDVLKSETVNPKAKFITSLGPDAAIHVCGSTRLRSTQKSCVEPSILSQHVTDIMGVACEHGPPKLDPNWEAYNATLQYIVDPADQFLPSELERARRDWMRDLEYMMETYPEYEDFRPLTFKESIMGIPGKRFLDPLIMSTSMGFPVFGEKTRFFTEHRDGERLLDRIPDPEIVKEFERLMSCWERGERAYPICCATLKDEPTAIGKTKVRVFQAAPVCFSLAIRMYFLPIARFLSLHPLESESAVGVNCFSPEWKELMDHAGKFGQDGKRLALDHEKYDVRMSSQIVSAVLKSFIELAALGGYPEHALKIMTAMIADMVHPMIDWNGTLLMAFNMNTSGNNITVNINSVAGSLYVRMGFFSVYPEVRDFRSCVAAMTYGDDFLGSVKEEYRGFNFHSFQQFLRKHNMNITPPDKTSEGCDFLDASKADFLKRVSSHIDGVPVPIGKLTEKSIFKSLHTNVRSKTTSKEEVAVSCMETALHEWFAYGREHYEERLEQMKLVARAAGLCPTKAFVSYDERVRGWHEKYGDQLPQS
jgi:hypothetical protein